MNAVRLLIALMMTVMFSSAAMAVDVNITGAVTGTYSLNSMSIASDGTIYLDISGGGICTPSSAVVNPTIISMTITEGDTASSQTVTIRDDCNNTLSYTATSGDTWISAPGSGIGTMNVTFNTSGLTPNTYAGTIVVTPSGYPPQTVTVNLTVNQTGGGGDPPGVITLSKAQQVHMTINAGDTQYFKFTITQQESGAGRGMQVTLADKDWRYNKDMMFSLDLPYPTENDYQQGIYYRLNGPPMWANIDPYEANETVWIFDNLPAGTYYLMIHSTATAGEGEYYVFYSNW